MSQNQAVPISTEPVSTSEIKKIYPGEWVLIGNPVMGEGDLHMVSGTLLDHSRDKRELAYRCRGNLGAYEAYTP